MPADEISRLAIAQALRPTMEINPKRPNLLYLLGDWLLEVEVRPY